MVLPSGATLTLQQTHAVILKATTSMNNTQIAKEAGYTTESACSRFLRGEKAVEGVRVALSQHLVEGSRTGLHALIHLATKGKNEGIRLEAAKELVRMGGLGLGQQQGPGGSGINISFNMPGMGGVGVATSKDVTPVAETQQGREKRQHEIDGGVGEKRGPSASDPHQPRQNAGEIHAPPEDASAFINRTFPGLRGGGDGGED